MDLALCTLSQLSDIKSSLPIFYMAHAKAHGENLPNNKLQWLIQVAAIILLQK
jgi:hypothetical protein